MLDECNANQITLARHFEMHLFIISVRSGTASFGLLFTVSTFHWTTASGCCKQNV